MDCTLRAHDRDAYDEVMYPCTHSPSEFRTIAELFVFASRLQGFVAPNPADLLAAAMDQTRASISSVAALTARINSLQHDPQAQLQVRDVETLGVNCNVQYKRSGGREAAGQKRHS